MTSTTVTPSVPATLCIGIGIGAEGTVDFSRAADRSHFGQKAPITAIRDGSFNCVIADRRAPHRYQAFQRHEFFENIAAAGTDACRDAPFEHPSCEDL